MSIRLNSSMPTFAMRQMNLAQQKSSISMQRLSSGSRINSATDDAAGLAIATGMTAKIQGYNQSIRNANDGISVLQVAEGTLGEVTNVLQRMRELTVQAGNDTNSTSNRKAIANEIQMLASGINDMMQSTEFNGLALFANRQGGFNIGLEGGDVNLDVGGFSYAQLALASSRSSTAVNGGRVSANSSAEQAININGINLTAISGTTAEKVEQLNSQLNAIGISAQASNQVQGNGATGISDGNLIINGSQVGASHSLSELAANINRDVGGLTARLDSNGKLLLSNNNGADISIDNQGNEAATGLVSDTYQGVISLHHRDQQAIVVRLNPQGVQGDLDALGLTERQSNNSLQSQPLSGQALSNSEQISINGYPLELSTPISSAFAVAQAFNDVSEFSGVTVSATTEVLLSAPNFNQLPGNGDDIRINGQALDLTATASLDDAIIAINSQLQGSGIVASGTSEGQLSLVSKLGYDIRIDQKNNDFLQTGLGSSTFHGRLDFQSSGGAIKIASSLASQNDQQAALAKLGLSDTQALTIPITGMDLSSAQGVSHSLITLDQAMLKVSEQRSLYGAQQNRLEHTINQLSGMAINSEAARSRIFDTDFAAESAALAKNQLLQQTSSAMLVNFTKMHGQQILALLNSLK